MEKSESLHKNQVMQLEQQLMKQQSPVKTATSQDQLIEQHKDNMIRDLSDQLN